jgi:tetratricopeptide (TPR) repeat protein
LNHVDVTGYYIADLDPLNCTEAYFYNAVANYKLNKIEAAEKSGLKAEHVDLLTRFPQLHLLLAEIFARKNDYATAISEVQTYLELAPHAKNADQAREQLAKLEKLTRLSNNQCTGWGRSASCFFISCAGLPPEWCSGSPIRIRQSQPWAPPEPSPELWALSCSCSPARESSFSCLYVSFHFSLSYPL